MKSLFILGRQPELGLAELESLFGPEVLTQISGGAALVDMDAKDIPFTRLGGSIKCAQIIATFPTVEWFDIEKEIIKTIPDEAQYMQGKLTLGISVYGLKATTPMIERTTLTLKKLIKSSGVSVRIVPNKSLELSTPQIIHNKLTTPSGWELVFYKNGNETIMARTVHIQDIEGYSSRDQQRPKRDARVGMLPPKLAQIIINFATGKLAQKDAMILDPFCGTGVILQEASLMGFDAYGTDIESRMVEYTTTNLTWLREKWDVNNYVRIEVGDATSFEWKLPMLDSKLKTQNSKLAIAFEGYLGLPFSHAPSTAQLEESMNTTNSIILKTFRNIANQVPSGTRMCAGLPAWHVKDRVFHVSCLHKLAELGWKRIEFKVPVTKTLIYRRDDQIVGRELVVLERI